MKDIYAAQENIVQNVKNILGYENFNQKAFAQEANLSASSISKIKNGKNAPSLHLLLYLGKKYRLTIDALKDHVFTPEELAAYLDEGKHVHKHEQELLGLNKYIGNYFAYYFFNGDISNRKPTLEDALDYGLICMHPGRKPVENELEVHAVMGIQDRAKIRAMKVELDNSEPDDWQEYFSNHTGDKHYYQGKLLLSPDTPRCTILDLHHYNDYAQILFVRPSLAHRHAYLGGLGTLNSLSKGTPIPCIQSIAIAKVDMDMVSSEEIAGHLFLSSPSAHTLKVHSMFNFIDKLYRDMNLEPDHLSVIIESYIQRNLEALSQEQQFKFYQAGLKDTEWYNLLKHQIKKGVTYGP